MAVNRLTLGWLGRALKRELAACDSVSPKRAGTPAEDTELARKLRTEAVEEPDHAERLAEWQVLPGVTPCGGQLPVAWPGRTTARGPGLAASC